MMMAKRVKLDDLAHLDEGDYRDHLRQSLKKARIEAGKRKGSRIGDSLIGLVLLAALSVVLLEHYGLIQLVK